MSGITAAEWINGMVILEAKHLLKFSRMSIQEISEYLHFPNQSFFTQYFRRETGMNPGCYRVNPDNLLCVALRFVPEAAFAGSDTG